MNLDLDSFIVIPLLAALGYEHVPLWGNALLAIWLWALGGNLGSFMNVVVYRVPLGRSVVHPGSRCPNCKTAIQWYDNIPVISWVLLRARCRHCKITISSRYPCVEALVAAVVLVVGFLSPVALGRNLPEPMTPVPMQFETVWLWLLFAFHVLLLCTLICAALIRYDRMLPPWRLFVPAAVVGCIAPMLPPIALWSGLRPVSFFAFAEQSPIAIAIWDSISGAAVGSALGLVVAAASVSRQRRSIEFAEVPAVALCGLFLGWQAVCAVACYSGAAHLATRMITRGATRAGRIPWTAHMALGIMLLIILWRPIVESAPWLGNQASIATFGLTACVVAVLGYLTSLIQFESTEQTASKTSKGLRMSPNENLQAILNSPTYRLAELDTDFLQRDELRPVRMQLELLKPEMALEEQGVHSTIVAFGGTQIVEPEAAGSRLQDARQSLAVAPDDPALQRAVARAERVLAKAGYYDAAREFSKLVSAACQTQDECDYVITTGGGPGIMEAANLGAYDVGAKSIGLNITLPHEQAPNPYITPELCFQFHYFALRKMHFLFRAKALVVFPGGFGTLDELFDALTLRQTKRMQAIPIILFGKEYWSRVIDFQFLADEGVIADEHLDLISFAETPEEAWELIQQFHQDAPVN
ncbi:MAG TPA: prepilin peptidase [Pirellulaceae bacterium]|nr:prepilin peptidase [Pirellulaceae bacterium]